MSKLHMNFGIALLALGLGGCFQEGVTLGLPCNQNDQCGIGQECDAQSGTCINEGDPSPTTTDDSTSTTGSQGEPCAVDNELRCDPVGVDAQVCQSGIWQNISCNTTCQDANEPPGKQVGACVEQNGSPTCLCADSIGGQCEGNEPSSCTSEGLLEVCNEGRFFRLFCETACADDEYPVGGPCVDGGQGQGSAACHCADAMGGSCTAPEQFEEGCESNTFYRRCVDEVVWLTDCTAECTRLGQTGGTCQDTGDGNFSCVCD